MNTPVMLNTLENIVKGGRLAKVWGSLSQISSSVDRHNFDAKSIKNEYVHVITPDLKRIPFSAYNMLHREVGCTS